MSWPLVTFGEIVENCNSKRIPLKHAERLDRVGDYDYYGASGVIDKIDDYLFDGDYLLIGEDGNNLISRSSPIAFHARGKFWVNNHAHVLKSNGKADLGFLAFYINSINLEPYVTGSAQPKLNKKNLDSIKIPLPPLDEQKRIAAILDKADAIRRKRQQAIDLADDFLRSVFLDMFGDPVTNPKGWEVKPLSELIAKGDKLNYGVVQPGDNVKDGVPLIRSGDLADAGTDINSIRKISETIDEKHRKSRLKGNEILIACVGSIGKVGWVNESMIGWNIARAVTRIPLSNDVNREYVYRYLQSPVIQGYFQRETRAVAQPTLNVSLIGKTPIALPPKELQEEFLKTFSKVGNIKRKFSESGTCDSELFDSLSQQAFAGEL